MAETESVLVKVQVVTINNNDNDSVCDGFCDGICFNLRLWQSLYLIKLQAFTLNGSDRVWDGGCF